VTRVPIRVRLAAAFALAMAVVLAGTCWFVYARLESHLDASLAQDLRLRTQDLSALVRHGGSLEAATGGNLVERGESYAELLDSNGRVLEATRPIGRTPLLTPEQVHRALGQEIAVDLPTVPGLDERSRLLATSLDGKVLAVGATLSNNSETLASLRDVMVIAGPIALVLASLAGYFLAGLSLRPVESMRRRAATISGENIESRLPVPRTHDEIARLAETLNEMLGRIEEVRRREQDFVADAGHELRTPLALLRTELELALRQSGSAEELKEAIRGASHEVDRLTQLAEGLLLIARADRGRLALQLEDVDVETLLRSVAERYRWRGELSVELPAGLVLHADRLRLEQALGNLVDNAIRHGSGRVELSGAAVDGCVELHVRDEGPGVPAGFADHAFERFTRPDEGRSTAGSGLGLSIVKVVVEAHGGSAHLAGSDVWMSLPTAAAKSTGVART
jgi:signal transduction histidine kinase